MKRTEHGQPGHLNIYMLDQESSVTGYGKHHRVVATLPDSRGLYCRVDHKHGPRVPTVDEILTVARRDQGVRGKWVLCESTQHADGRATDYVFERAA